eukprot:3851265-Pyramimonas_sp.AAC.2
MVRLSRSAFASSTKLAGSMPQLPIRIAEKNVAFTQMSPTVILLSGFEHSCTTSVGFVITRGHFHTPSKLRCPVRMHSQ